MLEDMTFELLTVAFWNWMTLHQKLFVTYKGFFFYHISLGYNIMWVNQNIWKHSK